MKVVKKNGIKTKKWLMDQKIIVGLKLIVPNIKKPNQAKGVGRGKKITTTNKARGSEWISRDKCLFHCW